MTRAPSRLPRAAMGCAALAAAAGAATVGVIPSFLAMAYLVLSALSLVMYWRDKSAAQAGTRRTPESRLHLVGLIGGWPGALIAQQRCRHKTMKQPFQTVFWMTVGLNLAAVVWLVRSGLDVELAAVFSG